MMKKRLILGAALLLILTFSLLGALAFFSPATYAEPSAPPIHYKITWDTLAYGGGRINSAHYVMDSTIGQAAVIPMHSPHYRLQNGYWGGWWPTIKTYLPSFLRRRH
jgi:hypothetical protein